MEARRTDSNRTGDRWPIVRRWPQPAPGFKDGLPDEAKLFWQYVHELAGCRVEATHTILLGGVAAELGKSGRSGQRALASLVKVGLVDVLERFQGRYTIFLRDPLIVARARLMPAGSDGQRELFADEPT